MYDVIIIGAGSAGMTAGIYAAKNKVKTLVIAKELSAGKMADDDMAGVANKLKAGFLQCLKIKKEYLEFQEDEVLTLEKNVISFSVETKSGQNFYAKSVIIASGETRAGFDLLTYKDITDRIKVDSSMRTNIPGIFAAGGVTALSTNDTFVNIGEGARALLSAMDFLKQPA
jgi:thioredoxin reductase